MILSANEKKPARGPWHAVALSVFGLLAVASSGCRTAPSTFLERPDSSDLRVVSYNVYWDKIFPDEDQQQAEKFIRVVKALDPDVLNLQEIRRDAADVVAVMNAALPLPNGKSWHAFKGYTNVIVSKYPLKMTADRTDPPGQRGLAMALVDLPDDRFAVDLYVLNNHFKCCGDTENDRQRQQQSDAVINWVRDACTAGGAIDLPQCFYRHVHRSKYPPIESAMRCIPRWSSNGWTGIVNRCGAMRPPSPPSTNGRDENSGLLGIGV